MVVSAMDTDGFDRSRGVWWGLAALLGGVLAFVVYSYVGTFVLGLFIYYAARPVHRRLRPAFDSRGAAAAVALLAFEIPFLAVTGYAVLLALRGLETYSGVGADAVARFVPASPAEVDRAIADPVGYVSALDIDTLVAVVSGGANVLEPVLVFLLHLALAVTIAFFCLRDGPRFAGWVREEVGEDSALWTYGTLVDRDLRVVYFGNVRTVIVVAVLGIVVYNGLNTVAPPGLRIPVPNVLALLTGAATLVPVVVGKLVYVPVGAYLAVRAAEAGAVRLWFPVAVVAVSLFALDLFPVMVVRPLLAGQSTHQGLMMFSYIFGGLTFGWYGIFLGPLLLVAGIHLVRVAFWELVRGEEITPAVTTAHRLGSMPVEHRFLPDRSRDHSSDSPSETADDAEQ
jgi:predicted PurR-regulated permease PerM